MKLRSKTIMYGITYLLFPSVNLLLARYTDIFTENYSYAGNGLQHTVIFYLWGSMCGIYFFITTRTVMDKIHYRMKCGRRLLLFSCLGMILSVFIPYLPDLHPVLGELHIYISILATVTYVLLFFHILLELSYKNYNLYKRYYSAYGGLVGFCLMTMILFGGVNTIMEFAFSCGQAMILTHLTLSISQRNDICMESRSG